MEIPREELKWRSSMSDGCMRKTVSNAKLKDIYPNLEFISIDEGLKITYEWFKENYKNIRNI